MKLISIAFCVAAAAGLSAQTKPVFTENFESGQLDPKVWDQRVDGVATLKVQQDQAAHGKYALQIHYPEMAARSYAFIVAPHLPDSVKTHFFGRAYVKIDPATPPPHTVLLFAGGAGWPMSKFEEIGVQRNTFQPSYQENKSGRGQGRGEDVKHAGPVPLGKWFLLEWEFNDNPSTLTIWADGELSQVVQGDQKTDSSLFKWPKGSDTDKDLVGGFEEFGFGTRVWGAVMGAFDVYYDDIAIGTQRIGPVK
jgi:hypothetical protein